MLMLLIYYVQVRHAADEILASDADRGAFCGMLPIFLVVLHPALRVQCGRAQCAKRLAIAAQSEIAHLVLWQTAFRSIYGIRSFYSCAAMKGEERLRQGRSYDGQAFVTLLAEMWCCAHKRRS